MNEVMGQLIFHGSIALLLGLIAGVPYGRAILEKKDEKIVHMWRLAHMSLPIGAILLFAIASFVSSLDINDQHKWIIAILFIVSVYAFAVAMFLGASIGGERGLTSRGPLLAKLVYLANVVGALTSFIASVLLVHAVWVSLI